MLKTLKSRLEEKYGLSFEIPSEIKEKLLYTAPEIAEPYFVKLMIEQNRASFEELRLKLADYLKKNIANKVSEKLGLSGAPLPQIAVKWNSLNKYLRFIPCQSEGIIQVSPLLLLEYSSGRSDQHHDLLHEYAHFLLFTFNQAPFSEKSEGKVHRTFYRGLGKGFFLEGSLFQLEGFSQFLAGKDHFLNNYEELAEAVKKAGGKGSWEETKFLRKEWDNPYSFGKIVYDLVNRSGGIGAVKNLAFQGARTRSEMIKLYQDCCHELKLEPILAPERKKRLLDVYEEMSEFGVAPQDKKLEKKLMEIDSQIEKLEKEGGEPLILKYYTGSVLSDLLIESYWHHGLIGLDCYLALTPEQMSSKNVCNGDLFSILDELEARPWNIFIDEQPENSFFKEICQEKGIAYLVESEVESD